MTPSAMHKPRRPSPLTPPHSNHTSPEPESEFEPTSPTGSESDTSHKSPADEDDSHADSHMDDAPPTPPVSPPRHNHDDDESSSSTNTSSSSMCPTSPSKTKIPSHPYPYSRPSIPPPPSSHMSRDRASRPRLTPMTMSTPVNPPTLAGTGTLPKSQPLSRALFARMANDVPHAGSGVLGGGGKKKSGGEKLIVPTKSFRTTFELGLTASEFARR